MRMTNYGGIWGTIPQTTGNVYWVSPGATYTLMGDTYSASDNNDGLSPYQALRTIDRAWNLVTANAGDIIMLLPGTHTVQTTSVAADVAGVSMFGLPGGRGNFTRHKTILTTDITGDEIINVTAANIEMGYFTLRPITASDALDLSAAADNFHLHNFGLDLQTPAVSTSTIGITLAAANYVLLEDFFVECDGAQGDAIVATGALDSIIRNFTIYQSAGTWASAILCGAATNRLLIEKGSFLCAGTAMTVGVNGTGATIARGVAVQDCRFSDLVTVAIDNFDATECEIAENYQLGVGAADGGVLITAIT